MVCQACQRVLLRKGELLYDSRRKHDSSVVHHRHAEDLRKAAEDEKCSFCHGLWMKLSAEARTVALLRGLELDNAKRPIYERICTSGSVTIIEDDFEWEKSKTSFITSRFRHSVRHVVRENGPWRLHISYSKSLLELVGDETRHYGIYDLYLKKSELESVLVFVEVH